MPPGVTQEAAWKPQDQQVLHWEEATGRVMCCRSLGGGSHVHCRAPVLLVQGPPARAPREGPTVVTRGREPCHLQKLQEASTIPMALRVPVEMQTLPKPGGGGGRVQPTTAVMPPSSRSACVHTRTMTRTRAAGSRGSSPAWSGHVRWPWRIRRAPLRIGQACPCSTVWFNA